MGLGALVKYRRNKKISNVIQFADIRSISSNSIRTLLVAMEEDEVAECASATGIVRILCLVGLEVFVSSRYHKHMLLCERLDDREKQQLEIGDWTLEIECQVLDDS